MEDGADAVCPSVGTLWEKKSPGLTFHLGRTSRVCDCVCVFSFVFYLFIYELSHAVSYEDGVKSHQL